MADITTLATSDTLTASRATLNSNFAALQNLFASASAPASPVAFQLWLDTSTTPDSLKMRNAANSAWIVILADVTSAGGGLLPVSGGTMTGAVDFGGFDLTNVGTADAAGEATNKGQIDAMVFAQPMYVGTLSASDNKYLTIAGTGTWTIVDVVIVSEVGITSDATHYWTFNVRNLTAGANLRSSAKSTNGAAITADTAYALGLDQNLTPSSGAVLQLQCTKNGSPSALTETLAVVRYSVAC